MDETTAQLIEEHLAAIRNHTQVIAAIMVLAVVGVMMLAILAAATA